jgi:hypothetical protein
LGYIFIAPKATKNWFKSKNNYLNPKIFFEMDLTRLMLLFPSRGSSILILHGVFLGLDSKIYFKVSNSVIPI